MSSYGVILYDWNRVHNKAINVSILVDKNGIGKVFPSYKEAYKAGELYSFFRFKVVELEG